jgi:hypothetical protein
MITELLLSPRRRAWVLLTALIVTALFSWGSIDRLAQLVDVQQLPSEGQVQQTLLERAEHNIASHLSFSSRSGRWLMQTMKLVLFIF